MAGTHASFSPSSSHRIITCPASYLACAGLLDTASWPAVEGTIAHYIHEQCLNSSHMEAEAFVGMRPIQFMDPTEMSEQEWSLVPDTRGVPDSDGKDPSYYWTDEDAEMLQRSIDWCRSIKGTHYVEVRVNISRYTPIPDQFGTADHFVIQDDGTLVITDLKWGKGVKVYAHKNYQAILYALGVIEEHDWLYAFDKVIVRIAQPRLDHFDVWETTADELRAIGRYILERFTLANSPGAPYNPDEKACKFCKRKPTCKALELRAQELAKGMFEDLTAEMTDPSADESSWPISAPEVAVMSAREISAVLLNRKLIEDFLEAVSHRAVHMLMHSQEVPEHKLVEGRSNRVIKDKAGYKEYLEVNGVDPFQEPELIGLTEAEKKLKKKKAGLAAFTDKPKGKPTLAHVSDKREAFMATADDMFDDVANPDDDI
jgi:hypothetical protein